MQRQSESNYTIISWSIYIMSFALTLVFITVSVSFLTNLDQAWMVLYMGSVIFFMQCVEIIVLIRAKDTIIRAIQEHK